MITAFNHTLGQSGAPGEIFGLDVAVRNVLRAWLRYAKAETLPCIGETPAHAEDYLKIGAALNIPPARLPCFEASQPEKYRGFDCLFRPDPNGLKFVWQRLQPRVPPYAFCGLVHTSSSERIIQVLGDYLTSPTADYDALICPSPAIKTVVEHIWDAMADFYAHRFGVAGKKIGCPVQLPVIPLGIDTQHFASITTPEHRAKQRAALNLAEDEVMILFVGRLSFATKTHPLPTLLAVERAAAASGKKVRLIFNGYFKPPEMETFFKALAADACRHAKVEFVPHGDARCPDGLWAAADIFTSLVDNIQESFGLTPVEAMASGLPAVISDWDGYRVSVRHGQDGFRIPTIAPAAGHGQELAERSFNGFDNYGSYLASAGQSIAIDIAGAAAAFKILIDDPAKRRAMGANGRARAKAVFDWPVIIPAYEALWAELGARAKSAAKSGAFGTAPPNWPFAHRGYPDPYSLFEDFSTHHLTGDDSFAIASTNDEIKMLLKHQMNLFAAHLLLPMNDILAWLGGMEKAGAAPLSSLLAASHGREDMAWRTAGWLLKLGICRTTKPLMPKPGDL